MLDSKAYVDHAGERCPHCGLAQITVQDRNYNGYNCYYQECWCKNCHSSWTEVYPLSGYEGLIVPAEATGLRVDK